MFHLFEFRRRCKDAVNNNGHSVFESIINEWKKCCVFTVYSCYDASAVEKQHTYTIHMVCLSRQTIHEQFKNTTFSNDVENRSRSTGRVWRAFRRAPLLQGHLIQSKQLNQYRSFTNCHFSLFIPQTHHMRRHVVEDRHRLHLYWVKNIRPNNKLHPVLRISFRNGKCSIR